MSGLDILSYKPMDSSRDNGRPILLMHTKSVYGGAQKYIYDLALALKKKGEPVFIVAGGNDKLATLAREADIPYHKLCTSSRDVAILSEFKLAYELWQFFRKMKPRTVHLNGSKIGTLGAVMAKLALGSGVKTIYSTHGLPTFEPRPFWQKILIWGSLQFATLFQNHIIAISKRDLEGLKKQLLFVRHKISYIPISIDTTAYHFTERTSTRKTISEKIHLPITEETIIIGTIAERTRNKALRMLVAAAKQVENTNVLFVLFGWGEETENLENLIKKLSLKNVFLLPGENAALALKGFDVFVLPSVKEGLPYTLLEAGLAHLPLVGTRVGGIPEVIKNNETGLLIEPNNPSEITSALRTLINDKNLRNTFGENAHRLVMKNFTIEHMLQQTFSLYNTSSE